MKKLISNQISPNLKLLDGIHAFWQIVAIFKHYNLDFAPFFGTQNYFLTNAARSGLAKILQITLPPKDKKIGIPAFCCAVMATPFLNEGYEIEWIDTDSSGLISVDDFQNKSKHISLVIVPHIFGQKAPIEEIHKIAKSKGIFVIEDCAHLWDTNLDFCDAKIFSFGREKVLSCVSGGAVLWPDDSPMSNKFANVSLPEANILFKIKHLLQPLILSISLPLWNVLKIGKSFAWLMHKLDVLPRAVTWKEKHGKEDFPITKMPTASQIVLYRQFEKKEKIEKHWKIIANKWQEILSELFPEDKIIIPENSFRVILHTDKQLAIVKKAKKIGFVLREWDGKPISPSDVDPIKFGYISESCKNAETFSQNYVTFPTNIRTTETDVESFKNLWQILN